jgi:hypothetical protein
MNRLSIAAASIALLACMPSAFAAHGGASHGTKAGVHQSNVVLAANGHSGFHGGHRFDGHGSHFDGRHSDRDRRFHNNHSGWGWHNAHYRRNHGWYDRHHRWHPYKQWRRHDHRWCR